MDGPLPAAGGALFDLCFDSLGAGFLVMARAAVFLTRLRLANARHPPNAGYLHGASSALKNSSEFRQASNVK